MTFDEFVLRSVSPALPAKRYRRSEYGCLGAFAGRRRSHGRNRPVEYQSDGPQGAPLRAQGEERHLALHVGRRQPSRRLRPQTGTAQVARQAASALDDQGPQARLHQAERQDHGQQRALQQARPKRHGVLRAGPQSGCLRRRHLHDSLDEHRGVQSRSRRAAVDHRPYAVRTAVHGGLGDLRPGQRVTGSAGLRRDGFGQWPQRRLEYLGQWVPAIFVSGHPFPHDR